MEYGNNAPRVVSLDSYYENGMGGRAAVGAELARPQRAKPAHSTVAGLRPAGPSKLGPYISGVVRSRSSFIVVRGPARLVPQGEDTFA